MATLKAPFVLLLISILLVLTWPLSTNALELNGFVEGAVGVRTQGDTTRKDAYNLLETRLQIKGAHAPKIKEEWAPELTFKAELAADGYDEELRLTVRTLALSLTPTDIVDLKIGRQILTWGTGDLLFINDLFPKDYISFFSGRNDEYLKLPGNAVKVSLFTEAASLDIVTLPYMEANESITGERFSFYDGLSSMISGAGADRRFIEPADSLKNIEAALRAYRTFGSFEGALYFFNGFYKEPRGILDPAKKEFFYPRLRVYGLSIRGPVLKGIGSVEAGYYDSREDRSGSDPLIENPALKLLAGYSRDFGGDLNVGLQYMIEEMLEYSAYEANLQPGEVRRDKFRHLLTTRITKLFKEQTVVAGLFIFYNPTDRDAYLRPTVIYDASDSLKVSTGANIFLGKEIHTEFGQFQRNDNLYVRVRYSF